MPTTESSFLHLCHIVYIRHFYRNTQTSEETVYKVYCPNTLSAAQKNKVQAMFEKGKVIFTENPDSASYNRFRTLHPGSLFGAEKQGGCTYSVYRDVCKEKLPTTLCNKLLDLFKTTFSLSFQ